MRTTTGSSSPWRRARSGCAIALAVLGLYAAAVGRGLVRHRGPDFPLLLGAAGALLAVLLHEIADFNLQIPANAVLFAATAGALLGALHGSERAAGPVVSFRAPGPPRERRRRALGRIGGVLLAGAATLAAVGSWREYEGRVLFGAAASGHATEAPVEDRDEPRAEAAGTGGRERKQRLERAATRGTAGSQARAALAGALVDDAAVKVLHADAADAAQGSAAEDLRRALAEVRAALRATPTAVDAWLAGYRTAQAASQIGVRLETAGPGASSEDLARRFADGAVRSDPHGGRNRRRLASLVLAAGGRDEARGHFCEAAGDPSIDARAVAEEMLDGGFDPATVAVCLPDRYDTRLALARLFADRRLLEDAERAWRRATELEPADAAGAWVALSHLAADQGRHAEALEDARHGLKRIADAPPTLRAEVLHAAAMASRATGDTAGAIAYAERCIEEDPGQLFMYHFAATLRLERGDTAEAIKLWKRLIEEHPLTSYVFENRALFHRSLAQAYERLGLIDPAADQYRRALEASPRDALARQGLSRTSRTR